MNYSVMKTFMGLLAGISIVLVFVEFLQSLVDGPGMFFVGGIYCPQASETCCNTHPLFGRDIPISNILFILRGGDDGDGLGSR